MSLAVQIVNYHTRRYLERCLASVVPDLERSGIEHEINLLDNASGEDLHDLAARFEHCRALDAPRNLGFGAGHNLLAAETDAPYLLILNPDVEIIEPRTAQRLLDAVSGGGRVQVAGPKLIGAEGVAQPYDHGRLHGARAQIALRGGHSYWRATDTRQEVAWVSGAAMLIEREPFLAVAGFDENLFLYKEEEDLCLRLRGAGGEVLYDPSVIVRHLGSVVADRSEELARSTSYFVAKNFPNRRSQKIFAAAHRRLGYLGW